MKKKIAVALLFIVIAAAAGAIYHLRSRIFAPKIVGSLEVISFSPQGEGVPISADGISVMFNKAIVPLTDLDGGRDRAIPITIEPSLDGKFFWLGTHGFIFRPSAPLAPSTKYAITMPPGIVSIDGYRLDSQLAWEFETVRPRVLFSEPSDGSVLLPKKAAIDLRFNVAMDRSSVERSLTLANAEGGVLDLKRSFSWSDDDHIAKIIIGGELPWGSEIALAINADVKGRVGTLGSKDPFIVKFNTPEEELKITQVVAGEKNLKGGKQATIEAGTSVCYEFNQAIDSESFKKSFKHEMILQKKGSKDSKKKPATYFHFSDYDSFSATSSDGKPVDGYKRACAAILEEYDSQYSFSIEPAKLSSLSGAKLLGEQDKYLVRTNNAKADLRSLLTKNVFSDRGSHRIPYRGINLKSAIVRMYRIEDRSQYDEEVRDLRFVKEDGTKNAPPPSELSLGWSSNKKYPVDLATMSIDQVRLPSDIEGSIPVSMERNRSTPFVIDLDGLPQRPTPGIYLVEVIGKTDQGVKKKVAAEGDDQVDGPPDDGLRALPGVYSMIQVTSVGLALKREVDHVLAWATDIESGAPLQGVPIKISFAMENTSSNKVGDIQMTKEGVTNGKGVAIIAMPGRSIKNLCAEVTDEVRSSYTCENFHSLGYKSDLKRSKNYFAYLYTDRPIYRPGQKIFFSSFIREVKEGRYFMPNNKLEPAISIVDASGDEVYTADVKIEGGMVSGEYELEDSNDLPRGPYRLNITIDGQEFSKKFVVASYRKPSFKVDVKSEMLDLTSTDELRLDVTGSYFFGAPMRKANAKWSIMTQTYIFSPEGFDGFSFFDSDLLMDKGYGGGDSGDEYMSDYEYDTVADSRETEASDQYDDPSAGSGSSSSAGFYKGEDGKNVEFKKLALDELGKLSIKYRPNLKKYPTSQILTVEANIEDPARQEVSASEDIIVHKSDFYIGLKPQRWTYGEKEKAAIDLISLDTKGAATGGKKYSAEIVRREYKYIERRDANGFWQFIYEKDDKKVQTIDGTTSADGKSVVSFEIPQGGEYRIIVKWSDSKGNEAQSATEISAWGKGYVPWRMEKPQSIDLVADKDSYKVGDTAKILVKSLVPVTKALMTLDRGRMLEYKIIDLGGNADHIEIPITEGMMPNIFVSVVAHAGRDGDRPPMLFSGEAELMIAPDQKRLSIEVVADRKGEGENPPIYRPGDEVKIHIKATTPDGKPVAAHLMASVADESVLRLLDYKLPDLVKKFFYLRYDSVTTSSLLSSLKAGDAGSGAAKKRRIFKDTAHFVSSITTDGNGEAEFKFKLPDDLTTWVVEVLGASDSKSAANFEDERKKMIADAPSGQSELGTNLALSDGTFVGGARSKIMTTLPVVLRSALPRFAVWGDEIEAKVIANNRTNEKISGKIIASVKGGAAIDGSKMEREISYSLAPNSEETFKVPLKVVSAEAPIIFSAEANNSKGEQLDSLETTIPTFDRFEPEIVATAGSTKVEERERIELPEDLMDDRGGLEYSLRASLALAASPKLRDLIYFPYGCSEQKSASLIALLIAKEMTDRYGEKYFDSLAPVSKVEMERVKSLDEKMDLLDSKISTIVDELPAKYQEYGGGMRYWPDGNRADLFATVQTLVAFTRAAELGIVVDKDAIRKMKDYIRREITAVPVNGAAEISLDRKAYALWGLTSDGVSEIALVKEYGAKSEQLSISGLSYLLIAAKRSGDGATAAALAKRITASVKQDVRHASWDDRSFFGSSPSRATSLAAIALLANDPADPIVPKALSFILAQKRVRDIPSTQDALYGAWLMNAFARATDEGKTDFKARITGNGKEIGAKSFSADSILDVETKQLPMKEVRDLKLPLDLSIAKSGDGTLYYDMELKYYLPPDKTPTREEGLIVSREYYSLADVKEEKPLQEFKAGENYKGHITVIVSQPMNYIVIEERLPSGFEPIDMTLSTSSKSALLAASEGGGGGEYDWALGDGDFITYDDVIEQQDYGMNFGFYHQEVRDDSIIWSDESLIPGVYHIRYPVRATTAGSFLMPGARAFEFYEPELFGRSRGRMITIAE